MLKITHPYRNKSNIFNMLDSLFSYSSDDTQEYDGNLKLDTSFGSLCEIFMNNTIWFRTPEYWTFDLPEIELPEKKNDIIVCLSGGKDSAAVAKYYKDKGYNVYLFHMRGINRSYFDEFYASRRVANYLQLPLIVVQVQVTGTNPFVEHPMKNIAIANGAIHAALAHNIYPLISFGNFSNSHLDTSPFDVCGGDCMEMWDAYREIIQKIMPNWEGIQVPLKTVGDTYEILKKDWTLFENSVSCMSPYRFREHWKHRTEQKYNLRIMANRCGCCWKDCVEWMWLADHNHVEYNEPYYLHCIEILGNTVIKEMGIRETDIKRIWKNYMWYSMSESKAYHILSKAILKGGCYVVIPD